MTDATSAGVAPRPAGTGYESSNGPRVASARPSATMAVSVSPGATALRRMPAPIHGSVTAWRRTQRATATLDAGYGPTSGSRVSASRRAAGSSPARQCATSSVDPPGTVVAELELTATAAAAGAAAS